MPTAQLDLFSEASRRVVNVVSGIHTYDIKNIAKIEDAIGVILKMINRNENDKYFNNDSSEFYIQKKMVSGEWIYMQSDTEEVMKQVNKKISENKKSRRGDGNFSNRERRKNFSKKR